ncbi:stage VI sporulation protein D [Fictibacillus macauensis ZFHKF-1]|uniref:Stage VI sporulation protein D n=1 Tax=Fictibacillus macauensis ZFHKF-1 TaxID=1196324 RepID=I8AIQ3_9BACL|nr:LysM peptidoglycan-binding domain-containing protein [Fictibacillus macauensis]EIT85354.1 stage VI sporulation protein D [Fictibacillus macauensis ZFHKF-1]
MNPSKLRFSIEESIWLKNGQEVAEVVSMAIDPEIDVTEENGQVYVRGALLLHGEYRPCAQGANFNLEGSSLREQASYRSLTQLKMNDEGLAELEHRFPIDITVPASKVRALHDVFVGIEEFDYDLPHPTCIALIATVSISGIEEEAMMNEHMVEEEVTYEHMPQEEVSYEHMTEEEAPYEHMPEEEVTYEQTPPPLSVPYAAIEQVQEQFQAQEKIADPQEEVYHREEMMNEESPQQHATMNIPIMDARMLDPELKPFMEEQDFAQAQDIFAPFQFEAKKLFEEVAPPPPAAVEEQPQIIYQRKEEKKPASMEPELEVKKSVYETFMHKSPPAPPAAVNSVEEVPLPEKQEKVEEQATLSAARNEENTLSLTKMLGGNEERFSKMKMYIMQRGESLESICEKYDISMHSLMRVNRMSEEEMAEGQIIYIPVSKGR